MIRTSLPVALVALLTLTIAAHGQTLSVHQSFGNARYEYHTDSGDFTVSPSQVLQIMKDKPEAVQLFKKSRSNATVSGLFGFMGGVLIAIPVGVAIGGGTPEWGFAAGGAALIGTSIPFARTARRQAESSFDLYQRKQASGRGQWEYFWSGTSTGIRFRF